MYCDLAANTRIDYDDGMICLVLTIIDVLVRILICLTNIRNLCLCATLLTTCNLPLLTCDFLYWTTSTAGPNVTVNVKSICSPLSLYVRSNGRPLVLKQMIWLRQDSFLTGVLVDVTIPSTPVWALVMRNLRLVVLFIVARHLVLNLWQVVVLWTCRPIDLPLVTSALRLVRPLLMAVVPVAARVLSVLTRVATVVVILLCRIANVLRRCWTLLLTLEVCPPVVVS